MKVYISGAMTGIEDYNFKTFNEVATRIFVELEKLKYRDIEIINPALISMQVGTNKSRYDYLREDIKQLVDCDIIVMLEGWKKSEGAKLECEIARNLGIMIVEKDTLYYENKNLRAYDIAKAIQSIVFGKT